MGTAKSMDMGRLQRSSERRSRIDPRPWHGGDTGGERGSLGRAVAVEYRRCPLVHGDDANEDGGAGGDW